MDEKYKTKILVSQPTDVGTHRKPKLNFNVKSEEPLQILKPAPVLYQGFNVNNQSKLVLLSCMEVQI
jgi:hypothetical protein